MITIAIVTALLAAVALAFRQLMFAIEKGLCWFIGFFCDLFDMMAGLTPISTDGGKSSQVFINIFFKNSTIQTIYWGMALIGIVMCFGFTIASVIRKSFDLDDEVKMSHSAIIRRMFSSILIILLMNFIMTATIAVTNTLLDTINDLFIEAPTYNFNYTIYYDEYDYAAMARCLNSIGNYSLNSSYNSRYNLNSCYNDIREDLQYLADKGKFDVTYSTVTVDNGVTKTVNTWQSVLQQIYNASEDLSEDLPLDEYNTEVSAALLKAMNIIRTDSSLKALPKYDVIIQGSGLGEVAPLDRIVMLVGSMYGSGDSLDRGTSLTDSLRGPYYYGQKDIFDYDTVNSDFNLHFGHWNHLTVIVLAILMIKNLLTIVFNAVARVFNMILLYLAAPPFIAVAPLDGGGKMKQWRTAFIIQSCGLFGTLMSLRLFMIFLPIIFDGDIRFFSGDKTDFFARVVIMVALIFTAAKASGMITGILADNAGFQAISAGDLSSSAGSSFGTVTGLGKSAASFIGGKAVAGAKWAGGKELGKEFPGGGGGSNSGGENKESGSLPGSQRSNFSSPSTGNPGSNPGGNPGSNPGNNPGGAPGVSNPLGGDNGGNGGNSNNNPDRSLPASNQNLGDQPAFGGGDDGNSDSIPLNNNDIGE